MSCNNQLQFKYVLADSWFSSNENMMYIRHDCDKHFIMASKSNRKVSLSEEDKKQGRSQRIDSVDFTEEKPIRAWIAGVNFPVLIYRQVFTNKDGSEGILYLLCSDLECDAETLKTIYKKRWKVEVFHKTLKSNASMAKSPSHTVLTQSNHLFMSIYSAFRLEVLASKLKLNHFELRAKLYLSALRSSFQDLQRMASA
nr:transposase [Endozoicomonas ascidiicola]